MNIEDVVSMDQWITIISSPTALRPRDKKRRKYEEKIVDDVTTARSKARGVVNRF